MIEKIGSVQSSIKRICKRSKVKSLKKLVQCYLLTKEFVKVPLH